MEIVNLSDIVSAGVAAANAYLHGSRSLGEIAAKNAFASIVGRLASYYTSNGMFDKLTLGLLPGTTKNYVAVFIARGLLALAMNERGKLEKCFASTMTDAFANELLAMVSVDRALIGGSGGFLSGGGAATGPVLWQTGPLPQGQTPIPFDNGQQTLVKTPLSIYDPKYVSNNPFAG